MTDAALPQLLHKYFHQWLVEQRNASHHTVVSYRDTWRLFLRHVATGKNKPVARLRLSDLTAPEVLAFLKHCEEQRNVSIGTRNCRLAALHSFYAFLMSQEPLAAGQCAEVLRIPVKRAAKREISYLDPNEVAAILAQPDRTTVEGQRDHTLLALLYNTGARIQEALDLCPQAVRLESPAQVKLMGKGRKERTSPLWPETVDLLKALLKRQPRRGDQPIFVNRYGEPLGAAGVRFKLKGTSEPQPRRRHLWPVNTSRRTRFDIQPRFVWLRPVSTSRSSGVGSVTHTSIRRITTHVPLSRPNARRWKRSTSRPDRENHRDGNAALT